MKTYPPKPDSVVEPSASEDASYRGFIKGKTGYERIKDVPMEEIKEVPFEGWWELWLTDDFVMLHRTRPNWFYRVMQRLLLGWRWEKIGD